MATKNNRRYFLLTASLAGSGTFLSSTAKADTKISYKRSSPGSPDLLKVGVVLGRSTHTKNIWYRFTNPTPGDPRQTGMLITHYWTFWDEVVEDFEKKTGATRVRELDGMIGKVDGIIVDEAAATDLQHLAAKPYLESGIPTFINRPFTSSVAYAKTAVDIAQKNGTPIMSASSFEYLKEAIACKKLINRGNVLGYEAHNASHDFYTHGLHGLWFAYACIGGGVSRISTMSEKWWSGDAITTIEHKPRGDKGETFYGTIRHGRSQGGNCGIRIYGPEYKEFINGPEGQGDVRDQSLWTPMLISMEKMFMTGEMPEPYEDIVEKTKIFLASFKSVIELDGAPVDLDTFDENWDAGPRKQEHYPQNSYTPMELREYRKALN